MKKVIAAYVTDRSIPWLRAGDITRLDILYYAFATVRDGKVGLYERKNARLIADTRKINPALKVVLSVGGWGAGGFSEAAFTAEGRALFVSSAMDVIRQYDFDGIDMDWEYPCSGAADIAFAPEDKVNFTLLLEGLRAALDAYGRKVNRPMHLSSAFGASQKCADDIECEKVGKILDHVNLMTYDMGGYRGPAGHHTNLFTQTGVENGRSGDGTVAIFAKAGMPVEKMVLGSAFYGRTWEDTPGLNQENRPGAGNGSKQFTEINRQLECGEQTRHWDERAQAPYAHNGHEFITYDDEESLKRKCKYVKEKNLAGIMFWEYGGDHTYKLVESLFEGMSE